MKKNLVYGVIGVMARNANYNAGYNKYPKQTSDGVIYASPQCFCYAMRKQLDREGKKVFYKKTYKKDGSVNGLAERYFNVFNENEDKKDLKKLRNNLFSCEDVRMFGCVYAGKGQFSVAGAVQIGMGINSYMATTVENEIILSPFANNKTENGEIEEKKASSLGTQIFTNIAHYLHSFTINPYEYESYIDEDFNGFTEDDYKLFKETSIISVSNLNTRAKAGCQNVFSLFVEAKEEYNNIINLNALNEYISVIDGEDNKFVYDLENISSILNKLMDKIKSIEIYYNPYLIDLKGLELKNVKLINIITGDNM